MELQLVDLGKELKRKTQESMSSRKKIEHLNDEYMASKDRADTISLTLNEKLNSLNKANRDLFFVDFYLQYFVDRVRYIDSMEKLNEKDINEYISSLAQSWPDPYKDLMQALHEVESNKSSVYLADGVVDELRDLINKRRNALTCKKTDFEAIRELYISDIKMADQLLDEEVHTYVKSLIESGKKEGVEYLITDDYITRTRDIFRSNKQMKIESHIRSQLVDEASKCSLLGKAVVDDIAKEKGIYHVFM